MDHDSHSHDHHHHEMPTEGRALTGVAISATLHCLTGCAIGEVTGMAIGTALGFSDLGTIALAVTLAFAFGYALTSLPLLRAGLTLSAVVPIALASDTLSIATMEIVDNGIMLAVPGAMEAGLGSLLFWGSLSFALAVAFVVTVPVNRWLLARGKGHTAVHETGIHGGPDTRIVGAVTILAAIFGISVLVGEIIDDDDGGHGGHAEAAMTSSAGDAESHGGDHGAAEPPVEPGGEADVHGVSASEDGLALRVQPGEWRPGVARSLSFQILGDDGAPVRDFDVVHAKQMHLIAVRRDMTGFQHLHPEMDDDGTWSVRTKFPRPGSYRVFADFTHEGENHTLGSDLLLDGMAAYEGLPPARPAVSSAGYSVELSGDDSSAATESELGFTITRDGEPVYVDPYLGADGHLVALREGDLAFLHVHPEEGSDTGDSPVRFMTTFPTEGSYRLFLQFRHEGAVHTAEFTREVTR